MYGALVLFESEFVHVVAISFTALILTELLMVALTIRTWHWLMVVAEFFSLGCYLASLAFLNEYFGTYFTSPLEGCPNQILGTLVALLVSHHYLFLQLNFRKIRVIMFQEHKSQLLKIKSRSAASSRCLRFRGR